jgi:hypothetical protein
VGSILVSGTGEEERQQIPDETSVGAQISSALPISCDDTL